MSLCFTCLMAPSSPYLSSPLSSTPLTCVFPLPGAPMSSVTSPVYSPESSSWSRLWDGHKVELSTPLQPQWGGTRRQQSPDICASSPFPKCRLVHEDGLETEIQSLCWQAQPCAASPAPGRAGGRCTHLGLPVGRMAVELLSSS